MTLSFTGAYQMKTQDLTILEATTLKRLKYLEGTMRHIISRFWLLNIPVVLVFVVAMATSWKAEAVEGGSGFYLLGGKGSLAGIMAPTGTYFALDTYFYSGDMSINERLPTIGGELTVGVDADVILGIASVLHVPGRKVLNGQLAYGVVVPVMRQDVTADLTLDLGGATIGGSENDKETAFGDPLLTAILGWSDGNLHTTLNMLLNIPVGDFEEGQLTNAGFNRWGLDTTVAVTYLNPETGIELTAAPGITLNDKNRDTDYHSGNEFHLEFAAMQHLSEKYAIGVNGYYYKQINGDKGSATGDFKGRVTALGPALNFNFTLGNLSVIGKAKYLHEFDAKNRMEGYAAFLQFAIPL
jgi:hypothetical protein